MMDAGHKYADDELKKLERRIRKQYKQAHDEMSQKLLKFANKFNVEDAKRQKLLQQGKITKKQYQQWRERQIFQSKRWRKLEQNLANDMANARNIAQSMTDNTAIDVYALNYNYGGFEVENGVGGFTNFALYDRNTVQRLMKDNPQLLKPMGRDAKKALAEGRIKRWNAQKLQSVAMQGIVQGESIPNIARRMADTLTVINRSAALRDARTMVTAAENSGRIDSYKRAQELGVEFKKMWLATEDARTRDTHREMSGVSVNIDESFEFPDGMLEYPADPAGPAGEVYNCRCTLVAAFDDEVPQGIEGQIDESISDMDYEDWEMETINRKFNEIGPKPTRPNRRDYLDENGLIKEEFYTKREAYKKELENWNKKIDDLTASIPSMTFEEVKEWGTKWGITVDNSIGAIDEKVLYLYTKRTDKLFKDFPEVLTYNPYNKYLLDYEKSNAAFASANYGFRFEQLTNARQLVNRQLNNTDNFYVNGSGLFSVFDHEFGHQVEMSISTAGMKNTVELSDFTAWKNVNSKMENLIKKGPKGISSYATTNEAECFAEGFAAWYSGEKTPFAKEFGKILKELRKK